MKYLFILALGLIVYISFNSTFINPYLFEGADKVKHFLAFFVLSLLFYFSFKKMSVKVMVIILILFSICLELSQSFIGREMSFLDFMSNLMGISLFIIFYKIFYKKDRKKHLL